MKENFKTAGTRAISFRQSTIFFKGQPLIGTLFDACWSLIAQANPENFQKNINISELLQVLRVNR